MDVLLALRAGDRGVATLRSAITTVTDTPPAVVHTSAEAELALRGHGHDLLVLDPDIAAMDIVTQPEGESPTGVVGWLRVRSSARIAELLDTGMEDVLDISMAEVELAARLRRVMARRSGHLVPRPVSIGELHVDARLRSASWQRQPLPLTPRELEVLQVLVAAGGHTVARDVIYRQVWRWAMPRGDRAVDVNIKRLRGKLAAAGIPVEIVTRPGVGYRLVVADPTPAVTGL